MARSGRAPTPYDFQGWGEPRRLSPNVELAWTRGLLDVALTCPGPLTNLSILTTENPIQITPNPVQSSAWLEFP